MRDATIHALYQAWWSTSAVAIVAIWYLPLVGTYHGRHRLEDVAPAGPRLDDYIDVLMMPIHTCALPPVAIPAAYAELGPTRFMAAKESMRRREAALRATRIPTGALVALSEYGTPVEIDEWAAVDDLIGAAT
jgi:hypothetical protein